MAELRFDVGDEVRLRLALEELDVTVLESGEPGIVLVKLKSGYNLGILKENILASRVLKKYQKEEKAFTLPEVKGKPAVGLIVTGGTIASKLDAKTGGVNALTGVGEFARFYPELFEKVSVKRIEVPFLMMSESMDSSRWIALAQTVKTMLDDPEIRGVIVTHGTDTLHYTASVLSFFLRNLTKPVILTYSQRSIDRASSDAHLNLVCSAQMALSDAAEVMLVGHANLDDEYCVALRGTKVRKMHSSRRDAFQPINCEPIAKVWPERVEFLGTYRKRSEGDAELDTAFSDKVAIVKFYPSQDPAILDYYAMHFKGIIIEATGLGHVAANDALQNNWLPKLKKVIREGLVVCVTTQTLYGRVNPYIYSNLRLFADTGAIFLEDMLTETAFMKLSFILGHFGWKSKVREKMLENMAGELNPRLNA